MENDLSKNVNPKIYYLPNIDNSEQYLVDGIFNLGTHLKVDFNLFDDLSREKFKENILEFNLKDDSASDSVNKRKEYEIRGLWLFYKTIQNGDIVFTIYNNRIYFGTIESEYFFLPADDDSGHKRLVDWLPDSIDYSQEFKKNAHFRFNKNYVTDHTDTIVGHTILGFFNKLFPKCESGTTVELIYGTNREMVGEKFTGKLDSVLKTGYVSVDIPYRMNFKLNNRWVKENREFRSRTSNAGRPQNNELTDISEKNGNAQGNLLLFIHGYNTSFDKAACRTAELAHKISFNGIVGFFSWPSSNCVLEYFNDKVKNDNSIGAFCTYLDDLLSKGCFENVYLVAHSMGCRLLFNAICKYNKQQDIKFHVLLAAADISKEYFNKNIIYVNWKSCQKMTSYVSSNDRALKLSRLIRVKSPFVERLGVTVNGIVNNKNLDKIDASNGTSTRLFSLNHSYIFNSYELKIDLFSYTFHNFFDPSNRNLLHVINIPEVYWSFKF